jgi:hypothetical protein
MCNCTFLQLPLPGVKIPIIFSIEVLIKSHYVVNIQGIDTTSKQTQIYCETMVYTPVEVTKTSFICDVI